MKKRYVVLISLSFLLIGAFLPRFKPVEFKGRILPAKSASAGRPDAVLLPSTLKRDEIYSAILLIPKSYLPLLEAFKSRKIAKNIKILPADVEWIDGKIMAISGQIINKEGHRQSEPVRPASELENNMDETLTPREDESFKSFFPLLLLQGSVKSMFSYNPDK
jgi:hypothetical protein